MGPKDSEERTANETSAKSDEGGKEGVDVASRPRDIEPHPDTPETMQHDHEAAPGRQRYVDARSGDYSHDFQEDGSGSHPVKPTESGKVDEDGVPNIAARKPNDGAGD